MNEKKTILEYLIMNQNKSRKKAKSLLQKKCIKINNKVITKHDYLVTPKDNITLLKYNPEINNKFLKIIYEDDDIIVTNKPCHLLTIATNKEKEKTLYHYVSEYVKEQNKKNKIYIIHRLDKDTSGIILFAKNKKIQSLYQNNWEKLVIFRGYVAIIQNKLKKEQDEVKLYLAENSQYKMYPTTKENGKESITRYKVVTKNENYSLVEIEIKTGRKNQIRATFEYLKVPIIGDKKYSSTIDPLNRIALHAYKLIVKNPITKKDFIFETDIPNEFIKIVKK